MIRSYLRRLSLRTKITTSFVLVVVFGTATSILVGSQIVTRAVLEEAGSRARQGMEMARLVYSTRLDHVRDAVGRVAASPGLDFGGSADLAPRIADLRRQTRLDFLELVDLQARSISRSGEEALSREAPPLPAAVVRALSGEPTTGAEILGESLRAHLEPAPTAATSSSPGEALAMMSAVPVRRDGRVIGAVYGGVWLSDNVPMVAEIRERAFGGEQFAGHDVGAVAVFMRDVRVSSTSELRATPAVFGDRLPEEAVAACLRGGERWVHRSRSGDAGFWMVVEPIRDHRGGVTGALTVGVLDAPYLAVRTEMMVSFLGVAALAVLILLALTFAITRNMIRPLEEMAAASRRIARGDLDHLVGVGSGDEIGQLAESFNQMVTSVRKMNEELQEWARTLEEKVEERTEQLASMQAHVVQSEKLASLGRMAAGVAHELNNPLGGILSFSMLALEELPADHPARDDLETVSKQALRCREIVRGLLDFSRQTQRSSAATDVKDVVETTLNVLEKQASFHNVKVLRQLETGLSPVRVDPGQLQQVVMNLVLNAVDAMSEGGLLTVTCERAADPDEIVLSIRDTGHGIPGEVLPYIFEPFFTTKSVGQGTGLGLSIVHGIVTRAGGRIDVDSRPGATTFFVFLPIMREESSGEPEEVSGDRSRQSAAG